MIIIDIINIVLEKFIESGKLYLFYNKTEIRRKSNKDSQRNKYLLIKLN
jgi:hypothetical protein